MHPRGPDTREDGSSELRNAYESTIINLKIKFDQLQARLTEAQAELASLKKERNHQQSSILTLARLLSDLTTRHYSSQNHDSVTNHAAPTSASETVNSKTSPAENYDLIDLDGTNSTDEPTALLPPGSRAGPILYSTATPTRKCPPPQPQATCTPSSSDEAHSSNAFSPRAAADLVRPSPLFTHSAPGAYQLQAPRHTAQDWSAYADYWRYGIRYKPPPDAAGSTRKRVLISGLPRSTTLAQLLSRVRGGLVVSCDLVDTSALPGDTGGSTALVRFHTEQAARAYAQFAADHPQIFAGIGGTVKSGGAHGDRGESRRAREPKAADTGLIRTRPSLVRVTHLPTPSYPLPLCHEAAAPPTGGDRSRCFRVFGCRKDLRLTDVRRDLRLYPGCAFECIESLEKVDLMLDVRFSSCRFAAAAASMLRTLPDYRVLRFVDDPCASPLEELLGKIEEPDKLLGELPDDQELLDLD